MAEDGDVGRGGTDREVPAEPTFADVLNNLSLDSDRSWWGRPGRHSRDPDPEPESEAPVEPADEVDEWDVADEPDDTPSGVRPYARTGGRTHPVQDLGFETLVLASERGRGTAQVRSVEHLAIARLCEQERSVAEVAALLPAPLGVARVLLADMADAGLVDVLHNAGAPGDDPDLPLLRRVLAGLRNL